MPESFSDVLLCPGESPAAISVSDEASQEVATADPPSTLSSAGGHGVAPRLSAGMMMPRAVVDPTMKSRRFILAALRITGLTDPKTLSRSVKQSNEANL